MRAGVSLLAACLPVLCLAREALVFSDGFVSGEVTSASEFEYGTLRATLKAGTCSGIVSGIGLYREDAAERHFLALWYSQPDGRSSVLSTSVVRMSARDDTIHFEETEVGWATSDPTGAGVELSIEWQDSTTRFYVNGQPLTRLLPLLSAGSTDNSAVFFTEQTDTGGSISYAAAHRVLLFSTAGRTPDPTSACLPQTSSFSNVSFEAVGQQPTWVASTAEDWNVAVGTGVTGYLPMMSPVTSFLPSAAVVYNTSAPDQISLTVGTYLFLPLAGDEDPDLVSDFGGESSSPWSVNAEAEAQVPSARHTADRNGRLFLTISSAGRSAESITVDHKVQVPGGSVTCSIARIRSESPRSVSMQVTPEDNTGSTVELDQDQWGLFNSCYLFENQTSATARVLLGSYTDRTTLSFYKVELDFMYTLGVSHNEEPLPWNGDFVIRKWTSAGNSGVPRFPWRVSDPDRWAVRVDREGNAVADYLQEGDGTFLYDVLPLTTGGTYRVSVTARLQSAAPTQELKTIFISVVSYDSQDRTGLNNVYGAINPFVLTEGETTTFTYYFKVQGPLDPLPSKLEIGMFRQFGGFLPGDNITFEDASVQEWMQPPLPTALRINPSLEERETPPPLLKR